MKLPNRKHLALFLGILCALLPALLSAQNAKPSDPLTSMLKVPSLFSPLFRFNEYLALHSRIDSGRSGALDEEDILNDSYGMNTNPQQPLFGRPRNHARGFQRVTNKLIHLFGHSYVQLGPVISIIKFD